jgi:FkbM family methyltransferase
MRKIVLSLVEIAARLLPAGARKAIYRVPWLARLVRRGLNRAAPRQIVQVRVAAGSLAGTAIWLDLQTEKDYWLGTYELELQEAIQHWVRPGMVAYDVGANIGYISLMLAKAVGAGGYVYAFEALPANVQRLRQNLADMTFGARMEVQQVAVVARAGEVDFLVGPSGGTGKAEGSAGRSNLAYVQQVSVPGISLDEFVYQAGHPAPQVIKLDIEGGEVLALPGMRKVLRQARPILLMELHGPESAQGTWQELCAASYRIRRLAPGYPVVNSLDELDWKSYLLGEALDG